VKILSVLCSRPIRYALCAMLYLSDFRIFSRGIVLPYRTTTGPTSASLAAA
jgi:hypothetical protein